MLVIVQCIPSLTWAIKLFGLAQIAQASVGSVAAARRRVKGRYDYVY